MAGWVFKVGAGLPRLFVWTLLITPLGIGYQVLPATFKNTTCDFYKRLIADRVLSGLRLILPEADNPTTSPDALSFAGRSGALPTASYAAKQIQDLICSEDADQTRPLAQLVARALPFSTVLASIVCLVFRPRPSKATAQALAPVIFPAQLARPEEALQDRLKAILLDYRDLSIRAAQFRAALTYAGASGAVTFMIRPDFSSEVSAWSGQNAAHLAGLILASSISSAWAAQRPGLKHKDQLAVSLAARIGWGGVFLGSFLALSISLPYRIITPVEPARLVQQQINFILFMRLLVLPTTGFVGAVICVAIVRRFNQLPVRLYSRR